MLAGAGDRDVTEFHSEFRDFRQATVASFNVVRENLIYATRSTTAPGVDERFRSVDGRFDQVDNGFIEMRDRLDAAAAGNNILSTSRKGSSPIRDERIRGATVRRHAAARRS